MKNFWRRRFFRLITYELPCLLAPLAKGKWALILLVIGLVLLLIGLSPFPLPELRIELPLGLFSLSLSLRELAQYSIPLGLVLMVLALLGLAAGNWAAPRARFWEELEARGIKAVWDGEREDFLERLDEAMGFALGRGPSGRILPNYVCRQEEGEILSFLREEVWSPTKRSYGVVIKGPPTAGKTRTAMELLAQLNLPFVLVWPRGQGNGQPFPKGVKLPVPQTLILADDLPLKPGGEGPSLPEGLVSLLHWCPGLALIATAREDRIPPDVRGVRVVTLQGMSWDKRLEELARAVARAEGRPVEEVRGRFTDHPGSLVAGLDVFRQRYAQLPQEMGRVLGVHELARQARLGELGRWFLQSARALWDLGVRTLTLERIWAVVEKAEGGPITAPDRAQTLRALEALSFLRVEREKKPEEAKFYEAVLTEAIPKEGEWERIAWEVLQEKQDAAAFVEIGNTWSEQYSPAYQRNPREALRKAIAAYEEALRFYTPEVAPLDYARIKNNLGKAYVFLARHEDPVGNLRRAITVCEEALRFCTPEAAPLDYARTQNNLGNAYRFLAYNEEPIRNLQKAIRAYEEALRFQAPEIAPLDYATTQDNLGLAYWQLAKYEQPVDNLRKAITAYEEALRFWNPEVAPLNYAMTKDNLGAAYADLAEHEEPANNLRKALASYEEALCFLTPEIAPLSYAMIQHDLGVTYRHLAKHENPMENLEQASRAFQEALRFYIPEQTPFLYAWIQYELGVTYLQRAQLQEDLAKRCADLQAAVRACREALRFLTLETVPGWHAEVRKALEEAEEAFRQAGCPGAS